MSATSEVRLALIYNKSVNQYPHAMALAGICGVYCPDYYTEFEGHHIWDGNMSFVMSF